MHELLVGKHLQQYWQPKGFSLEWTLRWRVRSDGLENVLWQLVQCACFVVVVGEVCLVVLMELLEEMVRCVCCSEMEGEEVGEAVLAMGEQEEVEVDEEVDENVEELMVV